MPTKLISSRCFSRSCKIVSGCSQGPDIRKDLTESCLVVQKVQMFVRILPNGIEKFLIMYWRLAYHICSFSAINNNNKYITPDVDNEDQLLVISMYIFSSD